jgi:hypothetical protein
VNSKVLALNSRSKAAQHHIAGIVSKSRAAKAQRRIDALPRQGRREDCRRFHQICAMLAVLLLPCFVM